MPSGILDKVISAALTTIGGNVGGDLLAPVVKNSAPLNVNIGSSRVLNIPTETLGFATALLGEYVGKESSASGYVEDFLEGAAGGLAGAADPTRHPTSNGQGIPMVNTYGIGGSAGVLG